jgi:hypothetical protein
MIARSQLPEIYGALRLLLSEGDISRLLETFTQTRAYKANKSFRQTVDALVDFDLALQKKPKK